MTATQKLQPNLYSLEFYEHLGVIRFIPYNNENRYILAADGELVSVLFSVASTKVSLCSLESVISEITDMEYISNKVRHKQEGSKQDMRRFSVIQAHRLQSDLLSKYNPTVEHSASRHLPAISWQFQDPSQQFPFYLITGLRPVFIVCTALFLSAVTLFAARLSRYTYAYSLVVRYSSESIRHRYRKMKMKQVLNESTCVCVHGWLLVL